MLVDDSRSARWRQRNTWIVIAAVLGIATIAPIYSHFADRGVLPRTARELHWMQLRSASPGRVADRVAQESFVSLTRTECFGYCPVYKVTVYGSGRVEFIGRQYVCDLGPRSDVIDRRVAAKLIADIEDVGFFRIEWQPGDSWSDSPTAITRLLIGNRIRTVVDYHGDQGVPRIMRWLEDAIDEVAGTKLWLPQRVGHEWFCSAADGTRRRIEDL